MPASIRLNHLPVAFCITLLACHPTTTLSGIARDELRLYGLPDALVIPASPSERCPPLHLTPDSAGRFTTEVCANQTYTVSFSSGTGGIYWRGESDTSRGGGDVSVHAWPAGNEPGIYVLGDTLIRINAPVALETAPVLPSNTPVRFPLEIPGTIPRVLPGQFLLLQGSEAEDTLIPLGTSQGTLSFARAAPPTEMGPWSFAGVNIAADGVVTPLPSPDFPPMKVRAQGVDLTYIPADLVPPGRYLVGKPGAPRAWMVDFGVDLTP